MSRWEDGDTSPVRSTKPDSKHVSRPQTPTGRQSNFSHPSAQPENEAQDSAPPKSHQIQSSIKTRRVAPTRHRRRRSKSLDVLFVSGDDDFAPNKPKRILSTRNLFQEEGDQAGHHRRSRSRSLDFDMDDVVFTSPTNQKSRGKCRPPVTLIEIPPIKRAPFNEPAKLRPNVLRNKTRNHRRRRSQSLDLNLDSNFLKSPSCEKSRGQCRPSSSFIGNKPLKFASDTPIEKINNTSSHSGRRSRSLDDMDLPPALPGRQQSRGNLDCQTTENETIQGDKRRNMLINPSYSQRQLMRRVSSLSMDDGSLRQRRTVMTDAPKTDPTPPKTLKDVQGPCLEEMNRLFRTQLLQDFPLEEKKEDEHQQQQQQQQQQGKESPSQTDTSKPSLPCHQESLPTEENQSTLLPPQELAPAPPSTRSRYSPPSPQSTLPPPPTPSASSRSRYTPPSPLWCSGPAASPTVRSNRKKNNKPMLSPFVSSLRKKALAGKSPRQYERKGCPPPPPPTMSPHMTPKSVMERHHMDSLSPNMWLLVDRKTSTAAAAATQYDVFAGTTNNKRKSITRPKLNSQESRNSGGSSSRSSSRVYRPPLPLQSASTFLVGLEPTKAGT